MIDKRNSLVLENQCLFGTHIVKFTMAEAVITRETELRKLPYTQQNLIATHLNDNRSWKQLMISIPSDRSEKMKYTSDHVKKIEEVSGKSADKLAALILFEEWGTSGMRGKMPTVGLLQDLLVQNSLFRAADYVAVQILKEPPPNRPNTGPAASIDVALPELEVEQNLDHSSTNGFSSSSTENNIAINSEMFENQAIVSREETNTNALTLSTMLPSSETIEGVSDVEIPSLNSITSSDESSNAETLSTMLPPSQDEIIEGLSSVEIPNLSLLQQHNIPNIPSEAPVDFQSGIPNISFLNGMNFAPPSFNNNSNYSNSTYNSSSTSVNSDSNPSLPMNTSLPKISFLRNYNAPDLASPEVPISIGPNVTTFRLEHLRSCTNDFNDAEFTDLNQPGRKLGSGGFGIVFLALDLSPDHRKSAVKRLNRFFYNVIRKFNLEVEVLSKHSHPNLVHLIGCSSADSEELCLIYEYISGGNLEGKLNACRAAKEIILPWQKRLFIAVGVARAIDYLHKNKLIHRDIKSANVLLDDNDNPKVCDFGLLRALNSRTTTMVVGSSGYMAPETVRGTFNEKVDIFAFGVVQLELLTGEPVLERSRELDLVDWIKKVADENQGNVTSLLDKRASHSMDDWLAFGQEWFDKVIEKSIEFETRKRSTIDQCLFELEKLYSKIL